MAQLKKYFGISCFVLATFGADSLFAQATEELPSSSRRILASTEDSIKSKLGLTLTAEAGINELEVLGVAPGSPADRAGLKRGDRLSEFAGVKLKTKEEFESLVSPLEREAVVELKFFREARPREVLIALSEEAIQQPRVNPPMELPPTKLSPAGTPVIEPVEELPSGEELKPVNPTDLNGEPKEMTVQPKLSAQRPFLGTVTIELTAERKQAYGLTVNTGALIDEVVEGSPAAMAGLQQGWVIVSVDGRAIDSPQQFSQSIEAKRPGEEVTLLCYDQKDLVRKTITLGGRTIPSEFGQIMSGEGGLGGFEAGEELDKPNAKEDERQRLLGRRYATREEVELLLREMEWQRIQIERLKERINVLENELGKRGR